jgi:hypothetical protein
MALAAAFRARPTRELVPKPGSSIRLLCPLAVAALVVGGCRPETSGSNVDLVLPDGAGRRVELVPSTAFAEYVELPELRRELRVTLANYDLGCDRYVAPTPSELLFVLTLSTPPKIPVAPGSFPIGPAQPNDAGPPERVSAFAVARQGEREYDFSSGGAVELSRVELSPSGHVQGVLALEFPGDGNRPAASARGKFDARLCRGE